MSLATGTLIDGKYRVVRTLGEGGVGVVYVAEHTFLQKQFALKLLRPEMAQYPEVAARFEQEARATSQIEHENIVRVTDFGRTPNGELYLVMELLPGRPLSDDLYQNPRVPRDRAIWIVSYVLRGLQAAHEVGIIHRDLKPENVLIVGRSDGSEQVKLVDFGIAKLKADHSTRLTQTGTVLGTPQYMAPEQARGVPDLDQRVDLHAVGVMLYEMLAGQPPYAGDNYNIVLYEILSGKPPPLTKVAPDVDPKLAAIVMKAFAPDRELRFQSAKELREALERYSSSLVPVPIPASAMRAMPRGASVHSHIASTPSAVAALPRTSSDKGSRVMPREEGPPAMMPLKLEVVPIGGADLESLRLAEEPRRGRDTEPEALQVVHDALFKPPEEGLTQSKAQSFEMLGSSKQPTPRPGGLPSFEPERQIEATTERPLETLGLNLASPEISVQQSTRVTPTPSIQRERLAPPPDPGGKVGLIVALVLLGAVGGGLALWRPWESAKVQASSRVIITLEGLPENSMVALDGVRRFINPIEIESSGDMHELRIECDGFRPKVIRIPLASNLTVDAHLEKAYDAPPPKRPEKKK
jgi:serine/threonine protein kinase